MPYQAPTAPVVQLALDFVNVDHALHVAREAMPAGITWVEAGTPLIKAEGLEAVRRLRAAFPDATVVADMKAMDAGRVEVDIAKKAGADVVMVLAAATDATVRECIEAARHLGVAIGCDLVGCAHPAERAKQVEAMGVDFVSVHTPIDQQMQGYDAFATLTEVAKAVNIPVSCAGGISPATAGKAVAAGARIIICGGAVTKAPDARAAAKAMLDAVAGGKPPEQALYQRAGLDRIRDVLARVSTPNLSDSMHRGGAVRGLMNINPNARLCGPAVTVVTTPGDWSKPVQAIDQCKPGDVLVIDAADGYPALWGGLASRTAKAKGLGGVVILGACRDLAEIHQLQLPVWASKTCPDAGEPRGVGLIGVPVTINGTEIHPGDWLMGDEDGLVVIPGARVVEVANRAQDIMEREQRLAAEIDQGRTLSDVAELRKWEQAK
jgi:3-hexulose-6-phosphate synthase/6-phospho-3-hexuloisomerase